MAEEIKQIEKEFIKLNYDEIQKVSDSLGTVFAEPIKNISKQEIFVTLENDYPLEDIEKEIKKIAEANTLKGTRASEDNKIINLETNDKVEQSSKRDEKLTEKKISEPTGEANVSEPKASDKNKKVPQKKLKAVEEFKNLASTKKTILIASIKNLPASQFQEISKKLRGKAIVKVPKKSISLRAIDSVENDSIKQLKEKIDKDIAILFSDLDAFELAGELVNSKSAAKAKPGQEAPEDIEVQEGPTDLVPGPAVSELGALGIQIKIENGKINIKNAKIIAKKGEKISQGAADLMSKLDIKPFEVGFEPLIAFDTKEGKLYADIKIDKEGTLEELKTAFGKALPFAVEIGYVCEDTIKFLISKAGMHEKALEKIAELASDSEDNKTDKVKTDDNIKPSVEETKNGVNNESNIEQSDSEVSENKNPPQLNSGEQN